VSDLKTNKTGLSIVTVIAACFLTACGMFSPGEVEAPQGVFTDPLHLSELMNHTNQRFAKSAYEDVLHPDFHFYGYNDKPFNQTDEIARLKSIMVDSTAHVSWDTCPAPSCPGTIQLFPDTLIVWRKFVAVYHKTASDSSVDSGEAQLRLENYAPKNTWTIRSWQEIGAISIFNPDFQQHHRGN